MHPLKIFIAFCLCMIFFTQITFGQRQNAVWCFGDSIQMRFDSTITITQQSAVNSIECSSSISDNQGNLLFYVGGCNQINYSGRIWNSIHNIMQNGDSVGLYSSSTNGGIIVPFPSDSSKFYIFSNTVNNTMYNSFSLLYHVVDMSQNNGLGEVIIKNQYLTTDSVTEKFALVRHGNGKDWWLIYHQLNGNAFFVSLIDSSGIHFPFQYNLGVNYGYLTTPFFVDIGLEGELVASQNGDRIVAVESN